MSCKAYLSPSIQRGFLVFGLLIAMTSTAFAEIKGWFHVQTDNYSDAVSIEDLRRDKPSSYRSGDHLYSFSDWQVGVNLNPWLALGYKQRLDLYANHSGDAALIYYSSAQKIDLEERNYNYYLDGYVQTGKAILVAVDLDWNSLETRWLVEVGKTTGLTKADIDGDLTYGSNQINGTVSLDYYYESDVLYDREVEPAEGRYYSISFKGALSSSLSRHELEVKDLSNETTWENAPYTAATMNTDRVADRDDEGHITIRPLGSGIETYRQLKVRLPARVNFHNQFFTSAFLSPIVGTRHFNGRYYPYLGARVSSLFELTFHSRTQSIGFQHTPSEYLQYRVEMDSLNSSNAHRIQFALSLNW